MSPSPPTVRLEFCSAFDMLDFVQVVSDYIGRLTGLDEDQLYEVSVAVRESVVNAIKHGNQNDQAKRVIVEFTVEPRDHMTVRVADQGEGFDPEDIPDPLAPENIMKGSGRGILFMRNYMDDVTLQRASEGGMEVRMLKKLKAVPTES
ncbi:MAG: ATP-binding protein [Acidobacteria bacterium]|nr:ATP-binding protein [Acidobacteriota bacterium]